MSGSDATLEQRPAPASAAAPWATLRFGDTRMRLAGERPPALDWALRFLAPHFVLEQPPTQATPDATLELVARRSMLAPCAERADARELFVRKSASPFFTVPARSATVDGVELVECTRDGTTMAFDAAARHVRVFAGDDAGLTLVELVRDVVLKAQENAGALVLHAAAVACADEAVLVVGGKGSGKSTTALELVRHHAMALLSGDKAILTEQSGEPRVAGWPDYPHLGYATILKHEDLAALAGIDPRDPAPDGHAFSPTGKYAVDPFAFRERFASSRRSAGLPVRALVLPAIGPAAATTLHRLELGEVRERLHANVDSAFETSSATWNAFTPRAPGVPDRAPLLDRLAALPAFAVRGPGDLAGLDLPRELTGAAT
jgi:hypothetical protein